MAALLLQPPGSLPTLRTSRCASLDVGFWLAISPLSVLSPSSKGVENGTGISMSPVCLVLPSPLQEAFLSSVLRRSVHLSFIYCMLRRPARGLHQDRLPSSGRPPLELQIDHESIWNGCLISYHADWRSCLRML